LGLRIYDENVETFVDEKGKIFLTSCRGGGEYISVRKKTVVEIDINIVDKGYISVTPPQIDQTDFTFIKKLRYRVIIPSKK
jgi:5'-nucleotidase